MHLRARRRSRRAARGRDPCAWGHASVAASAAAAAQLAHGRGEPPDDRGARGALRAEGVGQAGHAMHGQARRRRAARRLAAAAREV